MSKNNKNRFDDINCIFCGRSPKDNKNLPFIASGFEGFGICGDCLEMAHEQFSD